MRNATVLVLRLKGVATETIKNIVLAGIGTLIVVDTEDVSAEDLGAGFFFRDEDVNQKVSMCCLFNWNIVGRQRISAQHCKYAIASLRSLLTSYIAKVQCALYEHTFSRSHNWMKLTSSHE